MKNTHQNETISLLREILSEIKHQKTQSKSSLDKAIAYAKKFIEENARFPEEIDETIYVKSQLYRASYSQEGDYVEVFEGTLDP